MAVVSVPNPSPSAGDAALIIAPKQGDYIPLVPGQPFADIRVTFNGSISGPCAFWLEANGKPGTINVLDQVPSEPYVWQKVPEGQHRIQVVLWKPTSAMDATSQPKAPEDLSSFDCSRGRATVDIIVRRFEDFMPSYDWKPVERWYQLPPGLEISMDLSGEAKKAKIPEPWKWQVEIIGEGAEMIEVRRDSTMSELLEKMKLSDSTHEVVFCDPNGKHEISLKPDWTAQQADLFRYRDQVQVRRFASIVD